MVDFASASSCKAAPKAATRRQAPATGDSTWLRAAAARGARPPMLCTVGMAAISCSSALYLRSSASKASSVGLVRMNASYVAWAAGAGGCVGRLLLLHAGTGAAAVSARSVI